MKKLIVALSAALLCTGALAAETPLVRDPGEAPSSILIVGNSYMYYNCGLNGYLAGMIREKANPKIKTRIAAIGRGNLSQYPLEEYLDNALSKSHDAKAGTLAEDLQAAEVKKREKYSHVLMQASNRGAKDQARDAHYAKIHAEAIRASGAKPAMILTWTQKRKGSPEFGLVQDAVTRIANDNKMMVIPVGIAVERAIKEMPEVKFIMPDNTHPTAAGSYLMSSVIYASLYKRDPSDAVGFAGGCEKPLDPALREKLHRLAWATVREWFGW